MKFISLLFIVCLLGLGYHCQQKAQAHKALAKAKPDAYGFVPLPPPDEAQAGSVAIIGPVNCTREAGRRCDTLELALKNAGIPCHRVAQFSYSNLSSDQAAVFKKVFSQEIPVVFVGMRAKSCPTPEEVIAEYRQLRTGPGGNQSQKPKIY